MYLTSVWEGEDGPLIDRILHVHAVRDPQILDMTANKMRMWKGSVHAPHVTVDLEAKHNPTFVCDLRDIPVEDASFDVLVYDPPHVPNSGRGSKDFGERFGVEVQRKVKQGYLFSELHRAAFKEAHRIARPQGIILAKVIDFVHNHAYQWALLDLVTIGREQGFTPCDLIVKTRKGPIRDPKWKTQKHSRRRHSYWAVFRKGSCERKG